MANLIVSNVCDAACEYCFAASYLNLSRANTAPAFMSMQEYAACLDFLDRSEIPEVRLLGGEPTLHPQFAELVHMACKRQKRVIVFSHGAMPEKALESLEALSTEKCLVIVNMSAHFLNASKAKQAEKARVVSLKRLGERAMLGVNIQNPAFDLSAALQIIAETGIRKVIRLGIALPGPNAENHSVHPKQYRLIGRLIAGQARLAAKSGVYLDLDCGFVRCMFSDEEIEILQQGGMQPGWHCSPILDICPGGEILHCFSLSNRFKEHLSPQVNASVLRNAFLKRIQPFRKAGIFPECSTCQHKLNNECSGGCLSATLRRFQSAEIHLAIPQAKLNRLDQP